jgi:hypothetical protein
MTWQTSADYRAHLESIEAASYRPRRVDSPKPGYYVSAINDVGQRALCEGPFETHQEALCAVSSVSAAWSAVDYRACWYAWGTARVRG